jgi:hypothetical protein
VVIIRRNQFFQTNNIVETATLVFDMTILKALKKVDNLTKTELKHCIQRMDTEIEGYLFCSRNYPPDRWKRCGLPYLKRLEKQRQTFVDRLKQL